MRQYKLCIQNNNNNNNNIIIIIIIIIKRKKKHGAGEGREGESMEVRYFIFNFFSLHFFFRSTKIEP